ncbi:MAG TPA: hypothetical protein VMC61_02580 [Methanocella sp.]|nr:hypothetical protein [Methanocella sp.]
MAEDTDAFIGRLITYLSGQNDFVTPADIVEDRLSGLHSEDEIEPAIEDAAPFLEFKEDPGRGTMLRLSRSFDGYRAVFTRVKRSPADVYNFLYSNYSNAVVGADFIKEALSRILQLPYFVEMEAKYPPGNRPGDAAVLMLSQSPGFDALATMFRISPSVATYLLYPEVLSKYELTHLKVTLDLAFASDMLKRVPPATSVIIKYEVTTQGMLNLETRGGTGIP